MNYGPTVQIASPAPVHLMRTRVIAAAGNPKLEILMVLKLLLENTILTVLLLVLMVN